MATSKISINSYSTGDLVRTDPKSFISALYYATVVRYGLVKIINIGFVFNPDCTAPANEWVSSFTIPEGYESISGVQANAIFNKLNDANINGLEARVNNSSVDLTLRSKPTTAGIYVTQLVYV